MIITGPRRQKWLDQLAGIERDISLSLFFSGSDDRRIVCELVIAFPDFPEESLSGPGFSPGDDETQSTQAPREFAGFGDIRAALHKLVTDVSADLGACGALVHAIAYQGDAVDLEFCRAVVDLPSVGAARA